MKIYLPLILILPIMFLLVLIMLPLVVIVDLATLLIGFRFHLIRIIAIAFEVVLALRGARIEVKSKQQNVLIKVF